MQKEEFDTQIGRFSTEKEYEMAEKAYMELEEMPKNEFCTNYAKNPLQLVFLLAERCEKLRKGVIITPKSPKNLPKNVG